MNENLSLVEILKDCPQGTKLYSTVHGEVEFEKIIIDDAYPIKFNFKLKSTKFDYTYAASVSTEGRYANNYKGECILFPSKDQRDWSQFKILSKLIDGEFYYCVYNYNQKENHVIFIYKKHIMYKTNYYAALDMDHSISYKNSFIVNDDKFITELRKATEKEKRRLLNTIEIEGYKWDEKKKELIEPKFDITTLQPFDKVLCRVNNSAKWKCEFFSHICDNYYKFVCVGNLYNQCIPYNNETKHLVGTREMPPEKYITWED